MEEFSVENLAFEKGEEANHRGNGNASKEASHHEYKRCGWLCFQPSFLQRFRTAKWVLFWLCWAGAIQGKILLLIPGEAF